jgi:hypothetical protein
MARFLLIILWIKEFIFHLETKILMFSAIEPSVCLQIGANEKSCTKQRKTKFSEVRSTARIQSSTKRSIYEYI